MITGSKKTQRKSTTIQPRLWRRKKEQGGFVLVVMGLAAFALLGALGMAFDLGRIYIVKNETQNYCDAAALAAATKLDGTSGGITNAKSAATGMANYYNFDTATVSSPTVEFAKTSSGTWSATPGAPADYIYVRVKSSVS